MSKFDIIICVGPQDSDIIANMVPYTIKNVIDYRNIYLVCADPTINIDGTITIDEKIFPFNIDDLITKFGNNNRNGWYLQQLLKLYSGNVIPDILPNYVIIDSDTFFLKPVSFIDNNSKYIYTIGNEYHIPYFNHMNKLHPSLKRTLNCSGISHHMIMSTEYVNELFKLVESYHNNSDPFWKIFLNNIDEKDFLTSGASEYEIYFNYVNIYHKNNIIIRQLNWTNASSLNEYNKHCDYVSVHWYMRK
jgi:hypothetical protein